ncbi:MAG: phosphonate ABC transporter ATP-binding protein [Desulfovermiculus sp.]|nr:phosphonate ABC transporter ATP-binding protein [Desulfovermiculus sp.]
MLHIHGLSKRFGDVCAVDGLDLRIESGEMVGIIGSSGAGKSTFLRLINRLLDPSQGRIDFQGRNVSALKGRSLLQWRVKCAMIFQQFNLVSRLDVLTNVLVGRLGYRKTLPTLLRLFSRQEKALAIEALDRLDMAHTALQRAENLSGGQQQRVAIARALVQEPDLILADEPIASLDPHNATKVMQALQSINLEQGITVMANLHHLETARMYCHRIIGMQQGRIVYDGPALELSDERARTIYAGSGEEEMDSVWSKHPGPQVMEQSEELLAASA